MPQRAPPSRPFASAPNRAGPVRLFASVPRSPPSTQERRPRPSANEPGPQDGAALNDAAAHRAAIVIDQPSDCHVAQRSFRDKGDAPRNCARASAVQSTKANRNVVESCNIDQTTFGSPAHNKAVNAGLDPGSIAAFVDLIHLDALLEVEACFRRSSVTSIVQPRRLQHDDELAEARWRAGVVGRYQERTAKLQSVIADTNDATHATCLLANKDSPQALAESMRTAAGAEPSHPSGLSDAFQRTVTAGILGPSKVR